MTDKAEKKAGSIIQSWWNENLRPQTDTGLARGLRARLRRAVHAVDALAEPQAIALYDALDRRVDATTFAALLPVLASVEKHDPRRIARLFGMGESPALSELRFQRLIRSCDPEELATALRRALPRVEHACNIAALSEDFLGWSERVRIRWCLDYFGKASAETSQASSQMEETA